MKKVVLIVNLAALLLAGLSQAALAQGNASAGEGKITTCLACHGASGNDSLLPNVPKLGGQHEKYLLKQLDDIKSGTRPVPLMSGMLDNLNEQDLADVAAYYAAQPAPQGVAEESSVAIAEEIYRAGDPALGVAACTACHSPGGDGNGPAGYPRLSGQDMAYTEMQLKAFRSGERANDDSSVMRSIAARLNDNEIAALASYAAGLRQ